MCRQLNTDLAVVSSHHLLSNGQVEACITFVKHIIKICFDNSNGVNLALFQIRSMPIGAVLPSPATPLFKRPIRAVLPQINKAHQHQYRQNL